MSGEIITAIPEKWTGMKMKGIVIMAVDSMECRKAIYEVHKGKPDDALADRRPHGCRGRAALLHEPLRSQRTSRTTRRPCTRTPRPCRKVYRQEHDLLRDGPFGPRGEDRARCSGLRVST